MGLAAGTHTTGEIADRYGIKANHVYQIKYRVKNALAKVFEEVDCRLVA